MAGQYVSLDVLESVTQAQANPAFFLSSRLGRPLVIDECQLAPALFPALKEWVRVNKAPGQFLLTGSVRFSSRRAIRESLTGRLIAWELLPMDWSEMHETPLPDTLFRELASKEDTLPLAPHPAFSQRAYLKALNFGGLPGIFAVRDLAIRAQRFETQINTILERDLRLLIETSLSYRSLRALLSGLAQQAGGPLEPSALQRATRISLPTLRRLIPALEALFMIRLIPSEGEYSKPIIFFEDIGEQRFLRGPSVVDSAANTLLPFLYHHLRAQVFYRPELQAELFVYRDRLSLSPALCVRSPQGVLGIFPAMNEYEVERAHSSAMRYLQRYPKSKAWLVTVHDEDRRVSPRIRWLGLARVLGGPPGRGLSH